MACIIKVGGKFENLSGYNTFITDKEPNSEYFRISKFEDIFTAGKNLFLIEGSEFLKESTELKIEIVDVEGNTLYVEPGRGVPDYYEGNSVVLSTHVYETTPVGPAKITILGELKEYVDSDGLIRPIPDDWKDAYNVKWEKNFFINRNEANKTPVIFYKKPSISIEEVESTVVQQSFPVITQSGFVVGRAENPPKGTDLTTWRAGTLYRLERQSGDGFKSSMDENIIRIPSLNYEAIIKEVVNTNTVLVDKPFVDSNNKVVDYLTNVEYESTFTDFAARSSINSAVTASFGRIKLSNLDTFTGNVDKLKIFKKSRSDVGDYKFADEIKIVASNLLRDPLVPGSELDGGFGVLNEGNVERYWTTSSLQISGSETSISFDNDLLYESIKINIPSSSQQTESLDLLVDSNFDLYENVDYELNFKTLVSGSIQDVIPGKTTIVSESYSRTYSYLYDPSKLKVFNPTYVSQSSYSGLDAPNSSSVNLTKPLIYDNSRVSFYDTPQNTTGSVYTSIPNGYAYTQSYSINLTFDTTSGDWGTNSRLLTNSSDKANVVASSGSFNGVFNLIVWLDSGSYEIPTGTLLPDRVPTYIETYDSGSSRIAILNFDGIDIDAKFYYNHSSTPLNELQSFGDSIEYPLEPFNSSDYNTSFPAVLTTGSQVIIDYNDSGHHYIHIDYRTLRNVEPLNANLIPVKRLDSLDGDILYGTTYEINSINFDTGDVTFSHNATDGTLSGVVTLVNGQVILTIGSDTTTGYIVELDFEQGIMVFVGELDFTELVPAQRSYDLYDLFDLSGSNWISTGSTDLFVPRVPPRGGDYLYSDSGYPYRSTEFSDRNFLTTEFTSPSSSEDNFTNPLEIPYIFRNDDDIIENVYVEESDQIYVVSSVSSSNDINNTNYIYDQGIIYTGWFPTGSLSGSVYVDETLHGDTYKTSLSTYNSLITATTPISSSIGEFNIVLVTDSGSTSIPTNTGSVEFQIEYYQSASQELRAAIALRNVEADAMFYYNNSATSQSVLESYSGSTNIILDSIDSGDFITTPTWFLSTGSQAIFDLESGSTSHFIYIDYRTNRNSEPLNADLNEITAISQIGTNSFNTLKAREIFPLSGSRNITGSVTSTDYYTSQLPLVAGNYLYNLSDYPFIPASPANGTYITDDADPIVDITIPDTQFNIPYVFDTIDGKVETVLVKRLDDIYSASAATSIGTTQYEEPAVFVSKSLKEPDIILSKTISAFITGSYPSGGVDVPFYESLVEYNAVDSFSSRQQIQHLFTMPYSGSGKLGFSFRGDGWQLANIELKPTQDPSFSPKVFDTFDEQDRTLPVETFDYKFELYDINNNYIPVELLASKEFSGGNKVNNEVIKLLTFESDKTAFRFYSGSIANPAFQQVRFNFSKTNALTGSLTFASSAFDKNGNYIEPSSYGGKYPGALTNVTSTSALLTISNFSGSDTNYEVSSIIYTASVDDVQEYETIFRLEDGQAIADLIVNNDRNVVTFKQSTGLPDPPNQVSRITVKRKNLESNTEAITVNSSSLYGEPIPLTLLSDNSVTGVATYFVSGSSLNLQTGSITYEFSASDEFGVQVDNSTTVTPISFLGGVVLYLSNERGVLPAYYSGIIPSSSYVFTSGSTKMYVDGEEIRYDNGGSRNTYRITGVTGSGITPNEVAPTINEYGGVAGTMLTESSSLEINVRYIDDFGTPYDFGRVANFNIVREGEQGQPGLEGANGPGLVFTGPWTGSRNYEVNESENLSRADAVLYNDIFYLAIQDSGPGTSAGAVQPPNPTYWEELGSGSRFVAAELAIFAESYVQNTINVGTNNSGSTSAANITIAGGTDYPWISIGQSASTGTQGYNVGNGIFMGINGNSGTASLSLESPILGGNELLWDGETLNITGRITVTNKGDYVFPTETGSFVREEFTQSLVNPSEYSFGSVFQLASADAVEGLNLTADYLGYYDGSAFKSYMDSLGGFYLGGENGALQWDGNGLVVSGSIQVIGGNAATTDDVDNAVTSGSVSAQAAQTAAQLFASTAAAHAVTSGSIAAADAQAAATAQAINDASASINLLANGGWVGGNGTFITNTSISSPIIAGNGGYISSVFKVGSGITLDGDAPNNLNPKIYIGGGTWGDAGTSFYADVDTGFSLGDKLTWDGTDLTIDGGGSFSGTLEAGTILSDGTISGGTINGSTINVPETNPQFSVDSTGVLTATGANISGTFTAGNVSINNGNITIGSAGDIKFQTVSLGGAVDIGAINANVTSLPVYDSLGQVLFTLDTTNLEISGLGSGLLGGGLVLSAPTRVEGSLSVSTSISSDGNIVAFASDDRLKTRYGNITDPLIKIKKINGFQYKFNDLAKEVGLEVEEGFYVGVSAQEVEEVLPEVVKRAPFDSVIDNDGKEWSKSGQEYKTVQYEKIVPLLIEGIKELTERVERLEEENKKLKG